jgi:hypothetical protein
MRHPFDERTAYRAGHLRPCTAEDPASMAGVDQLSMLLAKQFIKKIPSRTVRALA